MIVADVHTVGVIGAGTMGHGIAQVAAMGGYRVHLYDVAPELIERGLTRIRDNLRIGVEKGKVSPEQRELTLERLSAAPRLDLLRDCQAVIEAVPEDLSLKRNTFEALAQICSPSALFATNTSSLSVTAIAETVAHPGRLVGMHFFNPVHLMKLVELVRAKQSSPAAIDLAHAVATRLGKEVIVVNDVPGFASSRLGIALGLEAIRMVEQGVASPQDIDRAMELGYGHPMGPLRLTDLVGLDVRLAIAEYLHGALQTAAFEPPELLRRMVKDGKLGKKSGEGFFRY